MENSNADGSRFETFVGRKTELHNINSAIHDAVAGTGRLILIEGEAGIGKTRLAIEASKTARDAGMLVLWGRCRDYQATPPYRPWTEVLRSYLEQTGRSREEAAKDFPLVAALAPEIGGSVRRAERAGQDFDLIDSLVLFFVRAARDRPVFIILENLHAADASSLRILEVFSERLDSDNVLLAGTYRILHPSHDRNLLASIGTLSALPQCRHVRLEGLDQGEVETFLESAVGGEITKALVSAVYQKTDGNCLFVKELARLLRSEDLVDLESLDDSENWISRIPDRMYPTIMKVVARIPDSCASTLVTASLLGDEFDLDTLAAVNNMPLEQLILELEPAVAVGILHPGTTSQYRFAHAVERDAIAAGLPVAEHPGEHLRIGLALEQYYGNSAAEHAVELVDHFRKAGGRKAPDHLFRYSVTAGKNAMAVWAYDEAARYFQIALEARGDRPPDGSVAKVWLALGKVQAPIDRRQSLENLSKAFEYFFRVGNIDEAVDIAANNGNLAALSSFDPDAVAALELKALGLVGPSSLESASMLMWYAIAIGTGKGDFDEATETLNRALTIARSHGATALQARLTAFLGAMCRDWHRYAQYASQAVDLLLLTEPKTTFMVSLGGWYWPRLLTCGILPVTRKLMERSLLQARRDRQPGYAAKAQHVLQLICQLQGHWKEARERSDEALDAEQIRFLVSPRGELLASRVFLEAQLGNFPAAKEFHQDAERYLQSKSAIRSFTNLLQNSYMIPAIMFSSDIDVDLTDIKAGYRELIAGIEAQKEAGEAPHYSLEYLHPAFSAYAGLGLIACVEDDRDTAQEIFEKIKSVPSEQLYPHRLHLCVYGRLQGMLACLIGRYGAATEYFERAIEFCGERSLLPELAWSCLRYGEMLSKHGEDKDRRKTEELLQEGLELSRKLGMKPLEERIMAVMDSADASPPHRYPNGLTTREVDVLRRLAAGKTNQEIGYELKISEHTVGNHVRRILGKIRVSNRVEAATFAVRQGLVLSE